VSLPVLALAVVASLLLLLLPAAAAAAAAAFFAAHTLLHSFKIPSPYLLHCMARV